MPRIQTNLTVQQKAACQVLNAPLYITKGISSIMSNIWNDFDVDIKTEFK